MKRKSRFSLFFATAVSLLGVLVASISTAAWFQLSYSQPADISNPSGLVAGDSSVQVEGVKGYKYMWDENTDGSEADTGTIIESDKEGTKNLASNYGNSDQDDIAPIDHADKGVGYYILGDETWASYTAANHDRMGGVAWKYSSSLKMDERYSFNYAAVLSVPLEEKEKIQIKKHTYTSGVGGTTTSDSAITTLGGSSSTYVDIDGAGEITIKEEHGGTYDIFVNSKEQIVFHKRSSSPSPSLAPSQKPSPKKSATVNNVDKIMFYLQDHVGDRHGWTHYDSSNASYCRIPIIHAYNIVYEDDSHLSESGVTYSMLNDLAIEGALWSDKNTANFTMNYYTGVYNDGKQWYYEFPWFIKSVTINIFISGWNRTGVNDWESSSGTNVWLSTDTTNKSTWTLTLTRADKDGYTYRFTTNFWDLATDGSGGIKIVTNQSSSDNWNYTGGSVTQYSITYKKNDTNTTLGSADSVYEYTYYTADDSESRKTDAGDDITSFRGWYTSADYADSFTSKIITSDTIIIGKLTADVYFALYIVKKKHDNSQTSEQYCGNGEDYYTSDDISRFDPDNFFTSSACALSYPGYDYPASPAWKIGSSSGDGYNKTSFNSFSYDPSEPVKLYLIIEEKTITLTLKWVKLKYNGFSDEASSLRVGEIDSTGTDMTAYGDTAVMPTVPSTYEGSPDFTGYAIKDEDVYWLETGPVDSPTLGTSYDESQKFTRDTDVFFLYLPDDAYVTYEYHLFVTDAVTRLTSEYTTASNLPDSTVYKRHYNDNAFALSEHDPISTWVVGDSAAHAAYCFKWDDNFYTDSACETAYGSGTVAKGAIRTLYIRLETTAENMYFDSKSTLPAWDRDFDTLYINLDDVSLDSGDDKISCLKMNDGIHRFYMTNNITFQIYNGLDVSIASNYTTYINLSEDSPYHLDASSKKRGHSNCIKNSNNTYGQQTKWYWSNYFGSSAAGSINRGATAYFTDSAKNIDLMHGDGTYNMYVYDNALSLSDGDAFALRFNNHGVYYWYDYDNLDSDSKRYVYDTTSEEYESSTIGGQVWGGSEQVGNDLDTVGKHAIKIKYSGNYNIYFTAQGTISLASVPSAKGEGYYIMPYDSAGINGNNLKSSFNNCLKMRMTELANGSDGNIAFYKNFNVTSSCLSFYIKSYLDGVDNGPMQAMGRNQYATIQGGVFTFKEEGKYNIYLQRSNSNSATPTFTIYITKNKTGDFFSMNEIVTEHGTNKTILEQKTTMVIEVKFKSAKNSGSVRVGADFMRTGSSGSPGLSKYLKFGVMYSASSLGKASFNSVRDLAVYNNASSFSGDESMTLEKMDSTPVTDNGSHYLYIFIDYAVNKATLEANRASLINDFKIVLKARG